MFTRLLRAATSPRNLATAGVLVLAVSGIAYAAIGSGQITNNSLSGIDVRNNSLTGLDVKNESLGTADVRNNSLRGRDMVANSVTGREIDEQSLGKVPSAAAADTATNATNATSATLADKAQGFSRKFETVSAFDAVDETTGRTNAPFVTLWETGSLKVQAKCFRDTSGDIVHGEIFATTTMDAALMSSDEDDLDGGATVNNTTYLFTDSALTSRQVLIRSSSNNTTDQRGSIDHDFTINGIDGSWILGEAAIVTRNGTPTGAPSTFYGTEHSCMFFGDATHSGTA